jgi:NAD(P)-dependent dehydrogenase (short-subunit alcohol dehydrogenase family)
MRLADEMTGRAALVTGAAGGLGRATAQRLALAGGKVLLVDIDAAGLEASARLIRDAGGEAIVHTTDLAQRNNCFAAVAAAVEAFGRLDALCNVAGVMFPSHTPEMSGEAWDKTIAVNLAAPFFLIQAAIPHLLAVEGAIVNVTSCAAFKGQAYFAAYCATKAGLTHMTKALAMEYMHQPLRINAVAPGGMMTALTGNMRLIADGDRSLLQRIAPLRGVNEIDDVAEITAFLASPAARGYHGACINVDQGITAG